MSESAAFLLQVSGIDPEELRTQSMLNLWDPAADPPEKRLARVEFGVGKLREDVLERLTWALLSWPVAAELELYDRCTDRRVAAVQRTLHAADAEHQQPYQWCDEWLLDPTPAEETCTLRSDGGVFRPFPPTRGARNRLFGTLVGNLVGLDDESLATRERLKYRLQRIFGRQGTAVVYNHWRTLRCALKGHRKPDCRVGAPVAQALTVACSPHPRCSVESPAVLMLLPRLSPGGAEKNAIDLAAALGRLGADMHMVTTFDSANTWSDRARATGSRVWHLPAFLHESCWIRFLDVYISRHAISVMHISNSHWMYDQLAPLKALHPGLRVVTQIHAEGDRGDLDYPTLTAREDAHVDCHTVISRHLADHLVSEHGADAEKIRVVNTGIDLDGEFSARKIRHGEWRREHGLGAHTPVVAFVGRFSDLKRPLVFLSVAELVLKSRPGTRFVMKGDGPLRADIEKRLAGSPGLREAVILEDARPAVAPLMRDADLLVLTSSMEGVAYVSYEAMALGLVQVSADVGAQSELITPDSGVLVPIGNGEERRFSEAVCALLTDDEERNRLSRGALSRIRQWPTVDDMATAYLDIYKGLLKPVGASRLERI